MMKNVTNSKGDMNMKKGQTFDEYMNELEEMKLRAEAFKDVINHIDNELEWMCDKVVEKESYYEEYVDDNGETKKRWHSAEYKLDENGKEILIPPTEGQYRYKEYMMMKSVKDEILAII